MCCTNAACALKNGFPVNDIFSGYLVDMVDAVHRQNYTVRAPLPTESKLRAILDLAQKLGLRHPPTELYVNKFDNLPLYPILRTKYSPRDCIDRFSISWSAFEKR